jgi:hypothetical protein
MGVSLSWFTHWDKYWAAMEALVKGTEIRSLKVVGMESMGNSAFCLTFAMTLATSKTLWFEVTGRASGEVECEMSNFDIRDAYVFFTLYPLPPIKPPVLPKFVF